MSKPVNKNVQPEKKKNPWLVGCIVALVVGIVLLVIGAIVVAGIGNYAMQNPEVTNKIIEKQVVGFLDKALIAYEQAEQKNDKAECCRQATIIAGLYYQSGDIAKAREWNDTREAKCAASGGEGADYSKYQDMYDKLTPEQKKALERYRDSKQ